MKYFLKCVSVIFFPAFVSTAGATVMSFTDKASFEAAVFDLPSRTTEILDFEDSTAGELLPEGSTLGSLTFTNFNFIGSASLDMKISDEFETSSTANYLGIDDPDNFNQFIAGDRFDLGLGGARYALGMYFITGDPLFFGDIILQTAIGSAVNSNFADVELADGGMAYFVGLVSTDDPFSLAQIRFDPAAVEAFYYNVDDIIMDTNTTTIPVPGTLILLLAGVAGLRVYRIESTPS